MGVAAPTVDPSQLLTIIGHALMSPGGRQLRRGKDREQFPASRSKTKLGAAADPFMHMMYALPVLRPECLAGLFKALMSEIAKRSPEPIVPEVPRRKNVGKWHAQQQVVAA
jgi:hypothetical protein